MATVTEKPQFQTFDVEVRQTVRVKLDPAKFTPEFMVEFRRYHYHFTALSDHAEHLAQLCARGIAELAEYRPDEFVEGYGPIGEMGISAEITDGDQEVVG